MSTRANRAKSGYDWRDAAAFVRQIETGRLGQIDGLDARQWARLVTLLSFCTPLSHVEAAQLPLLVLPPPRLRLLNPAQAVQAALTLCFARPGRQPRIDSLVRVFPGHVHYELRSFLTTLLARRIAAGSSVTEGDLKAALESAWCEPLVIRRWQRVALRMDAASCETAAQALPAAASGVLSLRYLSFNQATEGWALETRGMAAQSGLDWDRSPLTQAAQHTTVGSRFSLATNQSAGIETRLTI
jgi:hypothetical protein